jgi:hypothetical protein
MDVSEEGPHPKFCKYSLTKINMSSTATTRASSQPPVSVTPEKGRRTGTRGWKEPELEAMMEHIEEVMPCGSKQWEIVSLKLFESGYSRSASSLRKKFHKLWGQEKLTHSSTCPIGKRENCCSLGHWMYERK